MINMSLFLTKENFSEKIELKVLEEGCTYFQAILDFAEDCDKSPEEMLPFMSQVLIDKVKKSATDSGLIDLKETNLDAFCD